ncbi:MAG TPA: DUF3465 domain-containing protein [Candidatus Babeliales bacterium]|nr:DUF3465 domain-containing protein [Candidatus Babeliales bacterium]
MTRKPRCAAVLITACAALTSCATAQSPDNPALCSAYTAGRSRVEVVAAGTVVRLLGVQPGRESPHEGFLMKLGSGCSLVVRVEANTDFTGPIPLVSGQRVLVKGEYEYYPLGGVIHWTHRDPRGRHEGGYIESGGRLFF